MRMCVLAALCIGLSCGGCAMLGDAPAPVVAVAAPRLVLSESLMADCPDLPEAEDGSIGALLANHTATAGAYHACRDRHRGLVAEVRRQAQ